MSSWFFVLFGMSVKTPRHCSRNASGAYGRSPRVIVLFGVVDRDREMQSGPHGTRDSCVLIDYDSISQLWLVNFNKNIEEFFKLKNYWLDTCSNEIFFLCSIGLEIEQIVWYEIILKFHSFSIISNNLHIILCATYMLTYVV